MRKPLGSVRYGSAYGGPEAADEILDEAVYRRELRPVITTGAEIRDQLFTGT